MYVFKHKCIKYKCELKKSEFKLLFVSCVVCRFVTKLLEDLVFFVVDIPNSGQDVLEIMVNKPNRERQKLMREQNILKQVGNFCIHCPAVFRVLNHYQQSLM